MLFKIITYKNKNIVSHVQSVKMKTVLQKMQSSIDILINVAARGLN